MKTMDETIANDSPTNQNGQAKKTEATTKSPKNRISRRSFLGKSLALGAGTMGAGVLAQTARASGDITNGDIAILKWLAAAEIIEIGRASCRERGEVTEGA